MMISPDLSLQFELAIQSWVDGNVIAGQPGLTFSEAYTKGAMISFDLKVNKSL
jgi:hypothetical protein